MRLKARPRRGRNGVRSARPLQTSSMRRRESVEGVSVLRGVGGLMAEVDALSWVALNCHAGLPRGDGASIINGEVASGGKGRRIRYTGYSDGHDGRASTSSCLGILSSLIPEHTPCTVFPWYTDTITSFVSFLSFVSYFVQPAHAQSKAGEQPSSQADRLTRSFRVVRNTEVSKLGAAQTLTPIQYQRSGDMSSMPYHAIQKYPKYHTHVPGYFNLHCILGTRPSPHLRPPLSTFYFPEVSLSTFLFAKSGG